MRPRTFPSACVCAVLVLVFSVPCSAATPPQSPLAGLVFLVGDWRAAGSGDPGQSAGEFSFEWAADQHALVRHNKALTSSGRHEDIMLVYAQPDGTVDAIYVDNEGHTIAYGVTIDSDHDRVVFESTGPGPRFRLWYQGEPDGSLTTGFQIAPPGSSEFKTYLEGTAHHR